ncbi:hypothetical protein ACQKLP_14745 [Chitinophaga sp. NPDC101104]|uniref:hypothetical protein n=1 Tax=Chitinophaga sp. NPDC101104 TaxID=3390561 RepID=UPI003CFC5FFC
MNKLLLSFFEKLVRTELRQKSAQHPHPESMYFADMLSSIYSEREKLIEGLHQLMLEFRTEAEMEWIVRTYSGSIVELANVASQYIHPHETAQSAETLIGQSTWNGLFQAALSALSEALAYIEDKFYRYLDLNSKVPVFYQAVAQLKFDESMGLVIENFSAAGVSEKLLDFIQKPYLEFRTMRAPNSVSYQKLHYLNALMQEISGMVPVDPEDKTVERQIVKKLRELNYNDSDFFEWSTQEITEIAQNLPPKESLDQLIWIQKEINQIQHMPGMAYNPLRETLQRQLQVWLVEEIRFLRESRASELMDTSPEGSGKWKYFKVVTQFSVPQIGYILKLLCDMGYIQNTNKLELLNFFSDHFTSLKRANISHGSLRKNYYESNASVAAGVREILTSMLNQSKKGLSIILIGLFSF